MFEPVIKLVEATLDIFWECSLGSEAEGVIFAVDIADAVLLRLGFAHFNLGLTHLQMDPKQQVN